MKCIFILSNIIPARKEEGRAAVIFPSDVMEWRFESAKKKEGENLIL